MTDRIQPSYANSSIGSLKPRTGYSPTRSRSKSLSTKSANSRESSTVFPNCLVSVSRREAILTAGPMTVKSSRVRDPILPYMTSPTWTPMPYFPAMSRNRLRHRVEIAVQEINDVIARPVVGDPGEITQIADHDGGAYRRPASAPGGAGQNELAGM